MYCHSSSRFLIAHRAVGTVLLKYDMHLSVEFTSHHPSDHELAEQHNDRESLGMTCDSFAYFLATYLPSGQLDRVDEFLKKVGPKF